MQHNVSSDEEVQDKEDILLDTRLDSQLGTKHTLEKLKFFLIFFILFIPQKLGPMESFKQNPNR